MKIHLIVGVDGTGRAEQDCSRPQFRGVRQRSGVACVKSEPDPFGSSSVELVETRPSRTNFSTSVLDELEPALETNGVDLMHAALDQAVSGGPRNGGRR
jgi:hypothetical protein